MSNKSKARLMKSTVTVLSEKDKAFGKKAWDEIIGKKRAESIESEEEAALEPTKILHGTPKHADNFEIKWINIDLMDTPAYHGMRNPEININRRRTLLRHLERRGGFDFDVCEVGAVNLIPKTGRYNIIDGKGREWMARKAGVKVLPMRVYTNLSNDEEIELYKFYLSERTKGRPLDLRLADRGIDPKITAIMDIVEDNGFQITGSRKEGKGRHISLNSTLLAYTIGERNYKGGGKELLETILRHIKNTKWGESSKTTSTHAAMLTVFIGNNWDIIDHKRIRDVMDRVKPGELHVNAFEEAAEREILKPQPRHLAWLMCSPFAAVYNKNLAVNKRIKPSSFKIEYEPDDPDLKFLKDVYWSSRPIPKSEKELSE